MAEVMHGRSHTNAKLVQWRLPIIDHLRSVLRVHNHPRALLYAPQGLLQCLFLFFREDLLGVYDVVVTSKSPFDLSRVDGDGPLLDLPGQQCSAPYDGFPSIFKAENMGC